MQRAPAESVREHGFQIAIMGVTFAGVSLATGAPLGSGHAAAFLLTGVELSVVVWLGRGERQSRQEPLCVP